MSDFSSQFLTSAPVDPDEAEYQRKLSIARATDASAEDSPLATMLGPIGLRAFIGYAKPAVQTMGITNRMAAGLTEAALQVYNTVETGVQAVAEAVVGEQPSQTTMTDLVTGKYGKRIDGTQKGAGYLGELKLPTGEIATEYSVGVEFDGKKMDIPTLVPTLTNQERSMMINDIIPNKKPPPPEIIKKSVEHARSRINSGFSVWADEPSKKFMQTDAWNDAPIKEALTRLRDESRAAAGRQLAGEDSIAGNLTEGIVQFMVPFSMALKTMGGLKAGATAANIGKGMAAEAVTMFGAFDPHAGRFADLVRAVSPDGLAANRYIDWLTSRENEGEFEGRFKNVVDNAAGSAAIAGTLAAGGAALRTIHKSVNAPAEPKPAPKGK